ncbi:MULTISPECIES: Bug family tripartite tricarboxylate transporter substrate binding protein [Desulfosediminicola]|uniref:Bug family tripartite tricarboxylate transporter substrate binding protein n=1 Tax=Desulfosediminicola TaxID=2886823 RepID=UPI00142EDE81|nr:tripartite tricarboxylate transporter substrate binding protein [Desulfosediminicola ganghwensis]
MKLSKNLFSALLAVLLVAVFSTAHAYPKRTITMVVPFGAGGGTDTLARGFAELLSQELDQTIMIRNTSGASGTVGTAQVANARKDGYTIGLIPIGPMATQPHLNKLPYGLDSWEYIANIYLTPLVFLVDEKAPWNSIADIAEDGKSNPNKYVYGSSGPGTTPHIAQVATMQALGIEARHIPDSGTGPAMKSLAGGVIHFFSDTPPLLERYAVKGLGVYSDERLQAYPELPTMKEQGVDLKFHVWGGLVAPKGTPQEVVDVLAAATKKVSESAEFQKFMDNLKTDIRYMDSQEFKAFVESESEVIGGILESAGLKK